MTRIGITGHAGLTPPTRRMVAAEVATYLRDRPDIEGWTCLADGADQIFAWAVLAAGGSLVFVQPADDIEDGFGEDVIAHFRAARSLTSATVAMPFRRAGEDAYLAAGLRIVDEVDEMLAVWNGEPAVGKGGTGDVVAYAREVGKEPVVIWPAGAARR